MLGSSGLSRTRSFRPGNLGQNVLQMIAKLCFTIFVIDVLVFTVIAATYEPDDPLFHPSTKITTYLTPVTDATFQSENMVVRTGEDFMATNLTAFSTSINMTDDVVESKEANADEISSWSRCDDYMKGAIDCMDPEVYHLMMKTVTKRYKDILFSRFGKPVPGPKENTCDMAWRFRPKEGKTSTLFKDYRRFFIKRSKSCKLSVVSIGDYHSGENARKKKHKNQKPGFETTPGRQEQGGVSFPVGGDPVNDSLPVVESEEAFIRGKYLIYVGGGDRCKSMNHYLWSFLCALGEAQYLNRTLVMDLTLCLSSNYTLSNQDAEGKDFRFYFDFEHLKETASVLDQRQFWEDWYKWQTTDGLTRYLVDDFRVTPMMLSDVQDSLIMRRFGSVEPDNYWYRVCEGETESVVRRPWHLVWKSRRLMEIVSAIASRLNWDYDSVHIVRGEKARNTDVWPNLEVDTSPEALISTLQDKIEDGRNVYIATNEPDTSFFDPLKNKYSTHFLTDYKDLWDENSEWYSQTKELNYGIPVDFDGYMSASVDTEVFLRGKVQIEASNDLINDCKDDVNACNNAQPVNPQYTMSDTLL